MDFSIHQDWWKRPNNSKLLIHSFQSRGFQRSETFGNLDDIGYEESWMKNKIKVKVNLGNNGVKNGKITYSQCTFLLL